MDGPDFIVEFSRQSPSIKKDIEVFKVEGKIERVDMEKVFGVKCQCQENEEHEETLEEQESRQFNKANDKEKETVI